MGNRWGNSGNGVRLFFWAPKSLQMMTAAMKLKDAYSLEGKKQRTILYRSKNLIRPGMELWETRTPNGEDFIFPASVSRHMQAALGNRRLLGKQLLGKSSWLEAACWLYSPLPGKKSFLEA